MKLKQWIFRYLLSAQQKYEAFFHLGSRTGALGILQTVEETGKWPSEQILEWAIGETGNGRLWGDDILRIAKALMKGPGRLRADYLYTLIISEWIGCGPLVDGLVKLVHETGISPSPTAIESGLKQFIKKYPELPIVSATNRSEIESQFGVSVGQKFFDEIYNEVYNFYARHEDPNVSWRVYPVILHIVKNSSILPSKYLLNSVITKISSEGRLDFDENSGYYGDWVYVKDPELLEQFRRLEQGESVEKVLADFRFWNGIAGRPRPQEREVWARYIRM